MKRLAVFLLSLALLSGCATDGKQANISDQQLSIAKLNKTSPLPDDIVIIEPGPEVNYVLRAFSGHWYGKWGGKIPSQLVIEYIDNSKTQLVYSIGSYPTSGVKKGWRRLTTAVSPDGKIESGELAF